MDLQFYITLKKENFVILGINYRESAYFLPIFRECKLLRITHFITFHGNKLLRGEMCCFVSSWKYVQRGILSTYQLFLIRSPNI